MKPRWLRELEQSGVVIWEDCKTLILESLGAGETLLAPLLTMADTGHASA